MIRLIIFLIGALLLWILFISGFNKRLKIILSLSLLLMLFAGIWYENYGDTPRHGLISKDQIISCGVTGKHSYRSDYRINFCLQNNSKNASSNRMELRFIAINCSVEPCIVIESVIKDLYFEIQPEQQYKGVVSLAFDSILQEHDKIKWMIEVESVKAVLN